MPALVDRYATHQLQSPVPVTAAASARSKSKPAASQSADPSHAQVADMSTSARPQPLEQSKLPHANGSLTRPNRNSGPSAVTESNGQQSRGHNHTASATLTRRASDGHGSSSRRPSSAPGNKGKGTVAFMMGGASDDDDNDDSSAPRQRRPKAQLIRSKSDFGLRAEEGDATEDEQNHEPISEWGARHGFEDHYQSEDIISQLANVSTPSRGYCSVAVARLHTAELVYVFHR